MDNWRAGVVASTVANVAPRKKGAPPLKPSDFYPTTERRKQTDADQIAAFKAYMLKESDSA